MSVAARLESVLRPVLRGPLPVRLIAWDGSSAGPSDAPTVILRSPRALRRVLWHPGELGAAQGYVTGELDVDGELGAALTAVWHAVTPRDLPGVRPRDVARLVAAAARLGAIGSPLPPPDTQVSLRGRRNTRLRDRAAISHHYDASNDFYALLLGPVMAYSCAYYSGGAPEGPAQAESGLAEAQLDKLDMVCRKLDLAPGMRLLDIGCGWGALALHAAEHYDVDVVGLTISREQQRHLEREVAARDLTGRVEVRLLDYRDLTDGGFDAVASLEMGEHVGRRNYPRYAQTLRDAAAPGAPVLIQQMSRHGRHPGGGPFIESFIAPDMAMRPIGDTLGMLETAGLEVRDVQAMREHYVWTAWAWLHRLDRHWHEVAALLGEQGARTWRLYLAGGALAFEHGRMGVDQIVLRRTSSARPRSRSASRTVWVR
ncbi:class I SAM-dependent methyltransferase [Nocardia cyriacigeorgica]|uniref:class I SAM-dependent methyltransferase n=1 Tax=Nocardia cyriacigeorgica TaxID=135487 RepID=UPI001894F1C2|nr:cyclopropane-fatty-acyl-phospholipid synthase family protein [Nocardia cyriacigeorgica]MBF6317209.1 class I SAM-dependent methyltransferase [Nocardia cyriacigeorgica]MBF6323317.1 class I SAM-dependent methyltransferase [Nocardia cyriacigeorgica]MBF6514187.1 class I SAM-dependent methyltransferase [Nocardia cyriacigeorgica]MBF6532239.1 class I SAM-dependent methyltransferase [Nocardia cyriacigeorgica]